MGLGALFLLAFAGGLADLYGLKRVLVTDTGVHERMRRLKIGVTGMAAVAWLTVITGTPAEVFDEQLRSLQQPGVATTG